MKTTLFIGACITILITLKFLPYQSTFDGYIISSNNDLLLNPFLFFHYCFILLAIAILLTSYSFQKPLPYGLILTQNDKQLGPYFVSIAFWAAVTLFMQSIDHHFFYVFKGISFHIFLILATVFGYGLTFRWYNRRYKPAQLSMSEANIAVRSFLGVKKLKLDHLKALSYNKHYHCITIHFDEGMDNIKLYLSEYEPKAIEALIAKIKHQKGDTIAYKADFIKYFP